MQTNDKVSSALNHLTRGGFHYSAGKIHHESFGVLPSVEEVAEAVRTSPGEIAEALLKDAASEGLPLELDKVTVLRICVGEGTAADVQRLTEARAEAAERVYDLGKRLIGEAEGISADTAAHLLYVAARAGYVLDEDGMLRPFGGDSSLPAVPVHPLVIAAGEKDPVGLTKAFARLCTEIGVLPKIPGDAFTLSRQLAGYFHSALVLGLDELKTAIGERQSTRAPDEIAARIDRSSATKEDVYELCGRLAMEAAECES